MENKLLHTSFDKEIAFYESVCSGDIELVKMLSTPLCGEGYGVLSKNSLRNLKYHFIISVSLITRYCISSGMSPEEAYNLSDTYINMADEASGEDAINKLHSEMIICFTKKMYIVNVEKKYSKNVIKIIDYINFHINEKITIYEISNYISLNISYISRLFKEEVGLNISEYILIKKIEIASKIFKYSKCSSLDVSYQLNFSSQSYFIKIFKKYTGMTPKEYRKRYNFL